MTDQHCLMMAKCPCPKDCPNHGKCCACIEKHLAEDKHLVHCMKVKLKKETTKNN